MLELRMLVNSHACNKIHTPISGRIPRILPHLLAADMMFKSSQTNPYDEIVGP
jgi:hypothetical protein